MTASALGTRFRDVEREVAQAAERCGRRPADVRLVAASKTVDPVRLRHAISEGMTVCGENRVQEAASKWPDIRTVHPEIKLHLIGPLQSNKVNEAVRLFDVVHSLDRPKLAAALAACRDRGAELPQLLVQINIGNESQKAGVSPDELDGFVRACTKSYDLKVDGLMCIPPSGQDPSPYFAEMERMRQDLGLAECSMGMSGDFGVAIEHGATLVRVGSRIFGERYYP